MTQFSDLNDDILHVIFKWTQSGYDDEANTNMTSFLAELRLLCHRFSAIIPRYMFRAIEITISDEEGGGSSCALLKRTIVENPQFAAFVREIHIIFGHNYGAGAHGPANALLERLPNIRTLWIQIAGYPFEPDFLQGNTMSHLRAVNYSWISGTVPRTQCSI
ncbi:uncharacterized protein BDZ99DRAFT_525413 [Mytilinidion resinicola]|uniref:Uncharacterized protein n=1 Tax=Mytilinidion resinicola TaxID=574789 RepID=A0A6A6Y7K1_9PEZI|nr:uncharacterized protein BDZ99DRAFT_525413 [Mytilinidion resinicola]KAF2804579.1 hypothetical protein BDZ99DRAFT_525413 [Mytilinidion resinicola]